MGFEKISDQYYRQCRIEELRKKVLAEIDNKRKWLLKSAAEDVADMSYMLSVFSKDWLALDLLAKYFSEDGLFSATRKVYPEDGKVVYCVTMSTIYNMLRDKCDVAYEWLRRIQMNDGYDHIRDYLNADYFERIFDEWF